MVVVVEGHREGETVELQETGTQGQLNWYPSLVQRIGMSDRPSRPCERPARQKQPRCLGTRVQYVGTRVRGYMAGMGSTAKAVDAGVAGFNWNSPLVAHLARPGARITEAWLGKRRTNPGVPGVFERPPFLQPFQGCRSLAALADIHPPRHSAILRRWRHHCVPSQRLSLKARLSDLQLAGGLLLTSSSGPGNRSGSLVLQMQIERHLCLLTGIRTTASMYLDSLILQVDGWRDGWLAG